MSVSAATRTGPPFRLTMRSSLIVVAVLGLIVIYATDQVLPATTDRQAELRFWLAARATGVVALLLLTAQIVFGLVLSHPHNKTTWKLSKRIFPWHDHLWVFVMAFLVAHLVSLLADPKSGIDLAGAFIPGMSQYRSSPVALGTFALYAFLVTANQRAYIMEKGQIRMTGNLGRTGLPYRRSSSVPWSKDLSGKRNIQPTNTVEEKTVLVIGTLDTKGEECIILENSFKEVVSRASLLIRVPWVSQSPEEISLATKWPQKQVLT